MWSIFPCSFIILYLVSKIYLSNLGSWNLALFGVLFWWFAPRTFLEGRGHLLPCWKCCYNEPFSTCFKLCILIWASKLLPVPLPLFFGKQSFFSKSVRLLLSLKKFVSVFRFHQKWYPRTLILLFLTSLSMIISFLPCNWKYHYFILLYFWIISHSLICLAFLHVCGIREHSNFILVFMLRNLPGILPSGCSQFPREASV